MFLINSTDSQKVLDGNGPKLDLDLKVFKFRNENLKTLKWQSLN